MRAVLADLSVPRYLLTAASHGRLGGLLSLRDDLPRPVLPDAPGWLLLRPELSGICGSDLAVAHARFPAVPLLPGRFPVRL